MLSLIDAFRQKPPSTVTSGTGEDDWARLVRMEVERLPGVSRLRVFWRDFQAMHDWWPILIPLLLWIGWRTYRSERRKGSAP